GVLIPRPETEVLVREALEAVSTIKNPAVADLCSGSGCIAIAIARERADARVTAVEKYDDAYAFLERNLERNEVKNVLPIKADALGEFSQSLEGAFDLIVCNPPYIKTSDMRTLQREVRFEPSEALDGRQDGLYFYREITRRWMPCLTAGGRLIYETGYDQGAAVSEILQTNGFEQVGITRDYNDIDRVVYGTCTTVPTMTQER
ncbi:MAG: peptide chain release factor N(5)-glutamine methyltransferase, partial [Acetanaerobacterium sp.]